MARVTEIRRRAMAAKGFLTLPDAAAATKHGRNTLDHWRRAEKLRAIFEGGAWWTRVAWVEAVDKRHARAAGG